MTDVVVVLLLVGAVVVGWHVERNTPARKPSLKRCRKCDGDGVLPLWDGDTGPVARTCVDCEGDGWVPA
jgi:DnaJ-class molecular chaperone